MRGRRLPAEAEAGRNGKRDQSDLNDVGARLNARPSNSLLTLLPEELGVFFCETEAYLSPIFWAALYSAEL